MGDYWEDNIRLRKEIAELKSIIHDAVGPTVAWASTWQNRNGTEDLHPQHQALIARMTAAVNKPDPQKRSQSAV